MNNNRVLGWTLAVSGAVFVCSGYFLANYALLVLGIVVSYAGGFFHGRGNN